MCQVIHPANMCNFVAIMRPARLISIFFLLLYSYSQFQSLAVIGDYIIDYQYYKYEKCENKDRPELKCNGTCQLAKLLASPKKQAPELGNVLLFQEIFCLEAQISIPFLKPRQNTGLFKRFTFSIITRALKTPFPPPKN